MENYTYKSLILQLEGLTVTDTNKYPIFISLLLTYVFILIANVGIVVLIWTERSLHQPMYILFCNLSINDVMGNSLLVPRVLKDILLPPAERLIHYYECVVQAFTTHMFSTNAHTLSCEDVNINNVYGLTFTVVVVSSSIGSTILSYSKITAACLANKSKSMSSKALKTCSTHLSLYLTMLFSGLVFVILHRFPQYSEYRKISAILFNVVPASLNPVIYGVQSQEIQKALANKLQLKKPSL
ncbi:hypothetical protein Q8A73_022822 [Channa argus]|nr:hypothetical protein Q8A73_022822 [Channa argus]